jgi:hypothetical protein
VNSPVVSWIQDHAVLILAALALVEGIVCISLLRKARHAIHEMKAAQAAAIEAARAAALAAPGAIDPEAVLALLRQGHAPTLDNVYAMMRRREAEAAGSASDPAITALSRPVASRPRGKAPQSASTAGGPGSTSLTSSEVEERLRQYER